MQPKISYKWNRTKKVNDEWYAALSDADARRAKTRRICADATHEKITSVHARRYKVIYAKLRDYPYEEYNYYFPLLQSSRNWLADVEFKKSKDIVIARDQR